MYTYILMCTTRSPSHSGSDSGSGIGSCVVVVNWARKTYVRRVTVTSQRVDLPCACCIALSLLYDYCLHQGRKRVRNSQLQRLLSRPFSSRFG